MAIDSSSGRALLILCVLPCSTVLAGEITLRVPPAVTLEAGQQAFLAVHVQGGNLDEKVTLNFSGLPAHVEISPLGSTPSRQDTWRGVVKATVEAAATTSVVKVHARIGEVRREVRFDLVITRGPPASTAQEQSATIKLAQESEVFPVLSAEPPNTQVSTTPTPPTRDRWFLMKALQGTLPGAVLDAERLSVSGWTEASYTASTVRDNQLPMGFNYLANQFALQQNWLRVERFVVTSGTTEPTFGFRADTILPGADYRFTLARGLLNDQLTANDGFPNTYGIDPVQFYAEAYFPSVGRGLDIKVGRMFCQFGAEAIDAPSNALTSHSYTFIYDPFTQTGVMGTLQLTTAWSVQFGAILGPDVFIDPASSPYGMFSVRWAPPDGPDSVLVSGLFGSGRFDVAEAFNNPNIIDFVWTHTINARLTYTLDALFGYQLGVPDLGDVTWFSFVNYLTWRFTPRLTGTARLEFFDDIDGNRTGFPGLYTALTAGLNFRPRKEIILRPEVRYDHNAQSRPFQGQHGVFTAAADMIVRW